MTTLEKQVDAELSRNPRSDPTNDERLKTYELASSVSEQLVALYRHLDAVVVTLNDRRRSTVGDGLVCNRLFI